MVAGKHGILLDEEFLGKYPEQAKGFAMRGRSSDGRRRTRHDLDWGGGLLFEDSWVALVFDFGDYSGDEQDDDINNSNNNRNRNRGRRRTRTLTIYGSPRTPKHGISAFQYPPTQADTIWKDNPQIPKDTDILITHGPPYFHLDRSGIRHAVCLSLADEVARIRPLLVVFGHIHASYGREDVVFDSFRRDYEDVMGERAGWFWWVKLAWMVVEVLWVRVKWLFLVGEVGRGWSGGRGQRVTRFVNAVVVGGWGDHCQLLNEPVVVELNEEDMGWK